MEPGVRGECNCSLVVAEISVACYGALSSMRSVRSHRTSLTACAKAMYSTFVEESATSDCFLLAHEMAPVFIRNTYPLVDLRS